MVTIWLHPMQDVGQSPLRFPCTGNEGPLPRKLSRINKKGRGCVAHSMVSFVFWFCKLFAQLPKLSDRCGGL